MPQNQNRTVESVIPSTLLDLFKKHDTPTICNALELIDSRFRLHGFTTEQMICADPSLEPIVGYARTATIRALSPVDPKKKRETGMAYYEYVSSGPGPNISVIQDLDPRPGLGANWGEVNTNIHKALGVLGVITNGAIRDMDVLAPGFQLLAGKIVPSHAYVRIEDSGMEVNIFGMTVRHNDLIHADRHGAVVIPAECAEELPGKIDLMIRREKVILDACKDPGFNLEMLKQATSDSADIH